MQVLKSNRDSIVLIMMQFVSQINTHTFPVSCINASCCVAYNYVGVMVSYSHQYELFDLLLAWKLKSSWGVKTCIAIIIHPGGSPHSPCLGNHAYTTLTTEYFIITVQKFTLVMEL